MKKRSTRKMKPEISEYFFSCNEEVLIRSKIKHPINVFGVRNNPESQRKTASYSISGNYCSLRQKSKYPKKITPPKK